jgi:membrane fusion protein, copper/silver efflux system
MSPRSIAGIAAIVAVFGFSGATGPFGPNYTIFVAGPAAAQPTADSGGANSPCRVLFYRAPMGPETSTVPKKDGMGMDYLPVCEEPAPTQATAAPPPLEPHPAPIASARQRRILMYRAPMSADTSPVPKKDQMGMDYVPVYEGDAESDGTVTVSPERVQMLGVRTEAAREQVLSRSIRAVGTLAADERRIAVVAPRFEGWIQELYVNATGQPVKRGEPLFSFYSPEAAAAEREYLVARQVSGSVAEAAKAKLRNLGISTEQIERLARSGRVADVLTLPVPMDGVVMEKMALQGARFTAGETLYRIADLSNLWALAEIFEQDLVAVRPGESAELRLTAYPGRTFAGTVAFIYPTVNATTRTAKVRIELANTDGLLKPEMYATVVIGTGSGGKAVVTVPDSAVLDDGATQVVFVERGMGRYQPRRITTGRHGDGAVEVTSGIAAGDKVVVAANFLIDSESNLRSALQRFATPNAAVDKPP